jgi:hypothetical protein
MQSKARVRLASLPSDPSMCSDAQVPDRTPEEEQGLFATTSSPVVRLPAFTDRFNVEYTARQARKAITSPSFNTYLEKASSAGSFAHDLKLPRVRFPYDTPAMARSESCLGSELNGGVDDFVPCVRSISIPAGQDESVSSMPPMMVDGLQQTYMEPIVEYNESFMQPMESQFQQPVDAYLQQPIDFHPQQSVDAYFPQADGAYLQQPIDAQYYQPGYVVDVQGSLPMYDYLNLTPNYDQSYSPVFDPAIVQYAFAPEPMPAAHFDMPQACSGHIILDSPAPPTCCFSDPASAHTATAPVSPDMPVQQPTEYAPTHPDSDALPPMGLNAPDFTPAANSNGASPYQPCRFPPFNFPNQDELPYGGRYMTEEDFEYRHRSIGRSETEKMLAEDDRPWPVQQPPKVLQKGEKSLFCDTCASSPFGHCLPSQDPSIDALQVHRSTQQGSEGQAVQVVLPFGTRPTPVDDPYWTENRRQDRLANDVHTWCFWDENIRQYIWTDRTLVHHFSALGHPVYGRSSTSPATSLAIILSKKQLHLGISGYRIDEGDMRRSVMVWQASLYLDPVVFYGSLRDLEPLTGTALENFGIGRTDKTYSHHGLWRDDYRGCGLDEHVPLIDPLDKDEYDDDDANYIHPVIRLEYTEHHENALKMSKEDRRWNDRVLNFLPVKSRLSQCMTADDVVDDTEESTSVRISEQPLISDDSSFTLPQRSSSTGRIIDEVHDNFDASPMLKRTLRRSVSAGLNLRATYNAVDSSAITNTPQCVISDTADDRDASETENSSDTEQTSDDSYDSEDFRNHAPREDPLADEAQEALPQPLTDNDMSEAETTQSIYPELVVSPLKINKSSYSSAPVDDSLSISPLKPRKVSDESTSSQTSSAVSNPSSVDDDKSSEAETVYTQISSSSDTFNESDADVSTSEDEDTIVPLPQAVPSPVAPRNRGLVRSPEIRNFGALLQDEEDEEDEEDEAAPSTEARPVLDLSPPRQRNELPDTSANASDFSGFVHDQETDFGSTRPEQSASQMSLSDSDTHPAQRPPALFAIPVLGFQLGPDRKPRRAPHDPDAPRDRPPLTMDDLRPRLQALGIAVDTNTSADPTQSEEAVNESIADASEDEDHLPALPTTVTTRRPRRFATPTRFSLELLSSVAPTTPSAPQTTHVDIQSHPSVSSTPDVDASVISTSNDVESSPSRSEMEAVFRDFSGVQLAATLADSLILPDENDNVDPSHQGVEAEPQLDESQADSDADDSHLSLPPTCIPTLHPRPRSASPILTLATAFDTPQPAGNASLSPQARDVLFKHIRAETRSSLRASTWGTVGNKLKKTRKTAASTATEEVGDGTKGRRKGGLGTWLRNVFGFGFGFGKLKGKADD